MKTAVLTVLAAAILASHAPAEAAILYDNGPITGDSRRCHEDSGVCGGAWTLFDNFTLASPSTITAIQWSAFIERGLGDFNGAQAWIYDADPVFGGGSLLHAIPLQGASPVANAACTALGVGEPCFDLTLSGLSIALPAGSYYLGWRNDTTIGLATAARTGLTNGSATQWQDDGAGDRNADQPELAFVIFGDVATAPAPVPEPGTLALLALGIAGLGIARQRSGPGLTDKPSRRPLRRSATGSCR